MTARSCNSLALSRTQSSRARRMHSLEESEERALNHASCKQRTRARDDFPTARDGVREQDVAQLSVGIDVVAFALSASCELQYEVVVCGERGPSGVSFSSSSVSGRARGERERTLSCVQKSRPRGLRARRGSVSARAREEKDPIDAPVERGSAEDRALVARPREHGQGDGDRDVDLHRRPHQHLALESPKRGDGEGRTPT